MEPVSGRAGAGDRAGGRGWRRTPDCASQSFYMGGGTPTTLTARQMDRLLTDLKPQL